MSIVTDYIACDIVWAESGMCVSGIKRNNWKSLWRQTWNLFGSHVRFSRLTAICLRLCVSNVGLISVGIYEAPLIYLSIRINWQLQNYLWVIFLRNTTLLPITAVSWKPESTESTRKAPSWQSATSSWDEIVLDPRTQQKKILTVKNPT